MLVVMETSRRTPPTPSAGNIDVVALADWRGEYVSLELMGVVVDDGFDRTFVSGDVTLDRARTLGLIRALGTGLGKPEETEAFLQSTFDWQG